MRSRKRVLKKQARQTTGLERAGTAKVTEFYGNIAESACLLVKHGCRVESEPALTLTGSLIS